MRERSHPPTLRPAARDEWITLPIRTQDQAVHTVRGSIRVPTVLVAVNYARVPKELPVTMLIRNVHRVSDWRLFVQE